MPENFEEIKQEIEDMSIEGLKSQISEIEELIKKIDNIDNEREVQNNE